ncbi:YhdP family protein [Piscirickettsia litoralis]|uniref:YhdP central domain-containing protein n=1 Tax=Piscirickettsia litoralis TaxID=1891921 RepID=A0ABX3A197_9GAMM|nr:AsmA-like C-terminal region-containing protein [Piscirickettsia litoralis]ODN42598.1 hypothetical protein BGC07_06220 [Piscirickettsia litoralis]
MLKNARAVIYGQPVNFNINSKLNRKKTVTTIDFESWLSAEVVKGLAGIDLDGFMHGRAPLSGEYSFDDNASNLVVHSDLQGLSSSLPAPFNKSIDSKVVLYLHEKKNNQDQIINLKYGDQVKLNGGFTTKKGQDGLLSLQSHIDTLNLNNWEKVIQKLLSKTDKSVSKVAFDSLNLNVKKLIIGEKTLDSASVKLNQKKTGFNVDVKSSALAGTAQYKSGKNPELDLIASKTDLNTAKAIFDWYQSIFKDKNKDLSFVKNTKNLPKIIAKLNNVLYENYRFQSAELSLVPSTYGYHLDSLKLTDPNYTVDAVGELNLIKRKNPSFIKGEAHFKDVGKSLDSLGIHNLIGGGKGSVSFDLEWPGLVTAVKPSTLLGRIQMNLTGGHITKVNPGLISLINVFNVDSFWQRIKFDSTGILQKGLAFSELTGLFSIFHGNLFTNDTVVKGPDLQLSIGGRVGFVKKNVDLLVGAVPQVSGSIPVIALAAGGLSFAPIAGALWLFEKAVSSEVSNPLVFQYHVYGPWSDVQTKAVNTRK